MVTDFSTNVYTVNTSVYEYKEEKQKRMIDFSTSIYKYTHTQKKNGDTLFYNSI